MYDGTPPSGKPSEPDYRNYGFSYIRFNYAGSEAVGGRKPKPATNVQINDLTINGVSFDSFNSGTSDLYKYFGVQGGGVFGDLTIRGSFIFSGDSGNPEKPKFEIDLGAPSLVPLPGSVLLLGSGLLGTALVYRRRRGKKAA